MNPQPLTVSSKSQNDRKRLLLVVSAVLFFSGCHWLAPRKEAASPPAALLPEGALAPSARLIIGRVIALDGERRFAFVELALDAPANATAEGSELLARTLDLRETARLQVSRYVRGHMLGTHIVSGQPSPGDEVVWLAP